MKTVFTLLFVMLIVTAGCSFPALFGGHHQQTPPVSQQPTPTSVSGSSDVHVAWEKLALVGVVFGVAIGLSVWKMPFLTYPLCMIMSAIGVLIVVKMLLADIIWVAVAGVGLVAAFFVIKYVIAWLQLRKVTGVKDTLVNTVENLPKELHDAVAGRITTTAVADGTHGNLVADLVAKGYTEKQ